MAALGNGATVLARAGVLEGRKATTDPGALPFLEEHGANVAEEPIVIDGNLITARSEREGGLMARALLDEWKKRRDAAARK